MKTRLVVLIVTITSFSLFGQTSHPIIYALEKDKSIIWDKINQTSWASENWQRILSEIEPYVGRHQSGVILKPLENNIL